MPTINVFSKNKKNITFFHLKIIFFTAVKHCRIWPGLVFVMCRPVENLLTFISLYVQGVFTFRPSGAKYNLLSEFHQFKCRLSS